MHTRHEPTCIDSPAACGITGHALVSARFSEIAALRDRPGPAGAPTLPPRFLRHCDEHAVVGMHAVLAALAARGWAAPDLSRHAVVAASCRLGRVSAAATLTGLAAGGGVSVSPHIVPQCSLHAVAGVVSVGLGMHGPHLGVGGGDDALAEGLFAASRLARHHRLGRGACAGYRRLARHRPGLPRRRAGARPVGGLRRTRARRSSAGIRSRRRGHDAAGSPRRFPAQSR